MFLDTSVTNTSGVPAEALAVRLVADELKVDIYIWAKSKDNGAWALYGREAKAKKRTREMFLKLEDQHYEWLKTQTRLGRRGKGRLRKAPGGLENESLALSWSRAQGQGRAV